MTLFTQSLNKNSLKEGRHIKKGAQLEIFLLLKQQVSRSAFFNPFYATSNMEFRRDGLHNDEKCLIDLTFTVKASHSVVD